eukprot:2206734-Pyramimonas_sp.AAC.1
MILEHLRWQLKVLEDGVRPRFHFDGACVGDDHAISRLRAKHGDALGFRAAVVWVKGDWADANKTHGTPTVTSTHGPCPYCACTKN